MSKHFICLVFLLAIFCVQGFADEMKLHVLGNKNQGYYVNIYYGSQLIMEQGKAGELDLYFDNEDYSVRDFGGTVGAKSGTFRKCVFKEVGGRLVG